MPEVAIITDSLSCLPRDIIEKYSIEIVPINIVFDGKVYRDYYDLTPNQAYELFQKDPEAFSTAPSSPVQYLEALRKTSQQAKNILCITVSKHLSTVYNVARLAGEQASRELHSTKIKVIDSATVMAAQGFVVLAAARKAALGRGLDEVIECAENLKAKVAFALVLETIRHVYRTGRIPKIAAQAASVLPIKPILTSSSGVVKLIGMSRNMRQGIDHIISTFRSRVGSSPVHVAVMHAYAPDEAEKLQRRIASEFNCVEIWTTEVSPMVGYAIGAGALGFAYYEDEEDPIPG
jgi:DegV family protein with EDD domain